MRRRLLAAAGAALALLAAGNAAERRGRPAGRRPAEVNPPPAPEPGATVAILGAALIDGTGKPPVPDAAVLVRGGRIAAVGKRGELRIPAGAERVEAAGLTLLPGFLDSHFHLDGDDRLPGQFLQHGVTSVRDPGAWIEAYEGVRAAGGPIPRLFLTGPHLDEPPPAYPKDAVLVRDAEETRAAVRRAADAGASAIKVYFRLRPTSIRAAVEAAHARGLPVTAHLELVDAREAMEAGIDGIEHVTSLGTALVPARRAEVFRQAVFANNEARREGRYQLWSEIDPEGERAGPLLEQVVRRGVFLSPTLAVFERREGDRGATAMHVRAFRNMVAFTGRARRAGARVVVGSHSSVPHAQRGWAYHRELELLVESGFTPLEAIRAGTLENARFFRAEDRLGTVARGKLADLLLVRGDPSREIGALRGIAGVMLNGRWVVTPGATR